MRGRLPVGLVVLALVVVAAAPPALGQAGGAGSTASSAVAAQHERVDAAVANGSLRARLADADGAEGRAGVIRAELDAIAADVDALADRRADVAAAADNGTLEGDALRRERIAVDTRARALRGRLAAVEDAVADLPQSARDGRAFENRIAGLRADIDDVRDDQIRAAGARLEAGDPARTRPLDPNGTFATLQALEGESVERPVTDERIDFQVHTADGDRYRYAVLTNGSAVTTVAPGPIENPTLRVHVDHSVIRDLTYGDEPPDVVVSRAVDEGRLTYDGVGPLNSIVYGLLSLLVG